jgi:predicted DNA-binding transcriptional regulator AlpA
MLPSLEVNDMPVIRKNSLDRIVNLAVMPDDALLSIREISFLSSRSIPSLRRDVKAGRLPKPIFIGPQTQRWRVADVRTWMNGSTDV